MTKSAKLLLLSNETHEMVHLQIGEIVYGGKWAFYNSSYLCSETGEVWPKFVDLTFQGVDFYSKPKYEIK